MPFLALNDQIQIGAAKAFAKLAYGESRPRRRRERRHLQPTPVSLSRRETTQNRNNQFSHIQIIPKTESNEATENQRSHEPIFRKGSLMQDTGAEPGPSATQSDIKSSDSLANHTQGTTFAAKARAAELQAARARKELKLRLPKASRPIATHEVMTFKSKGRGGRQWKRLDLNSLPGPGEDENDGSDDWQQDSEVNHCNTVLSKNPISDGLQEVYDRSNTYLPTLTEAMQLTARPYYSPLSTPDHTLHHFELDEASQSYNNIPYRKSSAGQVSSIGDGNAMLGLGDIASGDEHLHKSPPTLPRLSRDSLESQRNFMQSQHISQQVNFKQHQPQQDEFQNLVSMPVTEHASPLAAFAELNSRQASSAYTGGSTDRYFGAHNSNVPEDLPIAYTQPANIPPLQSKPPHFYPAVKGTQNFGFKFPVALKPNESATLSHDELLRASSPLPAGYSWNGNEQELGYLPGGPQDEVGRPDQSVPVGMQDPFEASMPTHTLGTTTPPRSMVYSYDPSKYDLYHLSEELPWKDRYVHIHYPPGPSNPTFPPVFDGYELTADGPIKIGPSHPSSGSPTTLDLSPTRFQPKDERFHPELIPWMRKVIAYTRATNMQSAPPYIQELDALTRQHADQYALARANFSDERPNLVQDIQRSNAFIEHERAIVEDLLLPALASLKATASGADYFNRWGRAPDWSIDHGPDGNKSFFGGDWGAPPPRVGRDPRYVFKGPELMAGQRAMSGGMNGPGFNTGAFGVRGFSMGHGMGWGGN